MADRYLFQIFERDKDYLTPIIERLGLHKKYMKIFEEHSISFDVFRVLKEDHLEQMGMFCSSKLFLQVSLRATFLFIEISLLSLAAHLTSILCKQGSNPLEQNAASCAQSRYRFLNYRHVTKCVCAGSRVVHLLKCAILGTYMYSDLF